VSLYFLLGFWFTNQIKSLNAISTGKDPNIFVIMYSKN
jgi:hypothetical protein